MSSKGFLRDDGRAVVVAIDHPLYSWPCRGLEDRGRLIRTVVGAGADAIIASYGTIRTWAQLLGMNEVASLLEETLDEEKETDEKLSSLAESHINLEAADEEAEEMSGRGSTRGARKSSTARGARQQAAERGARSNRARGRSRRSR